MEKYCKTTDFKKQQYVIIEMKVILFLVSNWIKQQPRKQFTSCLKPVAVKFFIITVLSGGWIE